MSLVARRLLHEASTVVNAPRDSTRLKIPQNASIFSLIQPTGHPHLGNYLGALRLWKDISLCAPESATIIYGIADLHAITVPQDPSVLRKGRYDAIASVLSTGIDPERVILYCQSGVSEHSELNWILSCLAGTGYLSRMTQWKSKSKDSQNPSLGLFAYPVLQAADILLYKSTHVPVGEDQAQHLELTRTLATQFKQAYGETFPLPSTLLSSTKKILSLKNPEKKMSKSDPDKNATIFMTDEPEVIQRKIKKAITDSTSDVFSYDPENRPGVSNLINIVSALQRRPVKAIEEDIKGFRSHQIFKDYVTDAVITEFEEPRKKFKELTKDPEYVKGIIEKGNDRARKIAQKTMKEVKRKVGYD